MTTLEPGRPLRVLCDRSRPTIFPIRVLPLPGFPCTSWFRISVFFLRQRASLDSYPIVLGNALCLKHCAMRYSPQRRAPSGPSPPPAPGAGRSDTQPDTEVAGGCRVSATRVYLHPLWQRQMRSKTVEDTIHVSR